MIISPRALEREPVRLLFGSILTVTHGQLALVAILGGAGLGLIALLYRALVAVALDEEGARVAGLPVGSLNVALAGLAGVTIALSMRIVGILLIAALMVLPVTAAARLARSVAASFVYSMAIGLGSVFVGLTIAYYADLAPGGAIVLVAAGASVAATAAGRLLAR